MPTTIKKYNRYLHFMFVSLAICVYIAYDVRKSDNYISCACYPVNNHVVNWYIQGLTSPVGIGQISIGEEVIPMDQPNQSGLVHCIRVTGGSRVEHFDMRFLVL